MLLALNEQQHHGHWWPFLFWFLLLLAEICRGTFILGGCTNLVSEPFFRAMCRIIG